MKNMATNKRINRAHRNGVRIVEAPENVGDCVHLANVAEELVAQTFPL